jgi:hypothetical protein
MQIATYIHYTRPAIGQSNAYFLMLKNFKLSFAVYGDGTGRRLQHNLRPQGEQPILLSIHFTD